MKKLFFLVMIFLTACTGMVTKPEVTLKDVKLAGIGPQGVSLDFYLQVNNPNSVDLKLKDYSYDVKIMSLPFAHGSSRQSYDFYAKSTTDLLIPVQIPYTDLLEILRRLPDPNAIPYQLHANLTMGTTLGSMAVPVTTSGTIAIPQKYRPQHALKKIGDFLKGLEMQ